MGLFLVGVFAVSLVGVENASTGTFLLNLGMMLGCYAAHILTLLLMARQIPDETENGTIYPLLAKPVNRDTLLLGKWLACAVSGTGVLAVLVLLGWLSAPRMEAYHPGALAQALLLLPLSLSMLAALVLLLSLIVPRGMAVVLAGGIYFLGDKPIGMIKQGSATRAWLSGFAWPAGYLPDFSKLNLITRYTDGILPVSFAEYGGLVLYGGLCTALCLALAMLIFRRRAL
jgi:ABC-type transport system involved in multi-copper enzyme maturation permease subunit